MTGIDRRRFTSTVRAALDEAARSKRHGVMDTRDVP
jgi:hypothetical protein